MQLYCKNLEWDKWFGGESKSEWIPKTRGIVWKDEEVIYVIHT